MAFKINTPKRNASANTQESARPTVDWDAMHQHVVDACGTQDKHRTIPAFISGYYSLGKQPRSPYEAIYEEKDPKFADMKKDVEQGKATVKKGNILINGTWFNDVQVFSKPLPPREAIAWCVTFPQIIVDLPPFFGEDSRPAPLNIIMGGETFVLRDDDSGRKERVIQDPVYIQENTNNASKTWGFGTTTNLHKMGSALGLLNEHGLLTEDKLQQFLGKPLQFRLRVWNKPTKRGNPWYTEECKFVSEVPEGLPIPEFDESFIHGINFDTENDPETVKHLSIKVINTMKHATNFKGSVICKELVKAERIPSTYATSEDAVDDNKGNVVQSQEVGQNVAQDASRSVTQYSENSALVTLDEADVDEDFDDQIPF